MKANSSRLARTQTALSAGRLRASALAIACAVVLAHAAHAAVVEVGSTNVPSGASFSVPIVVNSGSSPLGLCHADIHYNTNVITCTGVTGKAPYFASPLSNVNNPGRVIVHAENTTSLSAPTGVTTVVELKFTATGSSGLSPLVIDKAELLDANASAMSASIGHGTVTISGSVGDSDGDGVPDASDSCPNTPAGEAVNAHGCAIAQLVPCAGPASGGPWKNHGQYVSSVAKTAEQFVQDGRITEEQKSAIVSAAARSNCGKGSGE